MKDKGFEILDFPCNQFANRAPGADGEIHDFCTGRYGITFPQYSKIDVNGENAIPLYKWLTANTKFQGFEGAMELMQMDKYECLKLENQICFPLYACAKEVVRRYKPFLDEIDLTYTQYITMMVLWEEKSLSVKQLGARLYLDSGTLTPLLKTLEKKGLLRRERSKEDERYLIIMLTEEGEALKEKAVTIRERMSGCLGIDRESAAQLYVLLHKMMEQS